MSKKFASGLFAVYLLPALAAPVMVWAQGPDGGSTGTATDVPAASAGAPNRDKLANAVGHNKVAINMMWVRLAGFLVLCLDTRLKTDDPVGAMPSAA